MKQKYPVIPKRVADWITQYRKVFDLYPALRRLENNSLIWEQIYKWYRMNTHEFVNAYLTGEYEVEKEPLYYALIKGYEFPNGLLSLHDEHLTKMSKEDWNMFGVNESNTDFVKVKEVEEEQRYYTLDSDDNPLLERVGNQVQRTTTELSIHEKGRDNTRFKLTEQEIKDYDSRYLAFAEPVEKENK